MLIRLSKIILGAAIGLYLLIVALNNVTDYKSNYEFVRHVLAMDTTFPGNALMWRAIQSEPIYHLGYASIILWEAAAAVIIFLGAVRLWQMRHADAATFQRAKHLAVAGLVLNLLLWLVAFITIGGEWFLMWQSSQWNGLGTASRMFTIVALVVLFLNTRDDELASAK
jgi:predicted small integral membrane protein